MQGMIVNYIRAILGYGIQGKSPRSPLWAGNEFPGTPDCALLMSPQQEQEYHPELFRI